MNTYHRKIAPSTPTEYKAHVSRANSTAKWPPKPDIAPGLFKLRLTGSKGETRVKCRAHILINWPGYEILCIGFLAPILHMPMIVRQGCVVRNVFETSMYDRYGKPWKDAEDKTPTIQR